MNGPHLVLRSGDETAVEFVSKDVFLAENCEVCVRPNSHDVTVTIRETSFLDPLHHSIIFELGSGDLYVFGCTMRDAPIKCGTSRLHVRSCVFTGSNAGVTINFGIERAEVDSCLFQAIGRPIVISSPDSEMDNTVHGHCNYFLDQKPNLNGTTQNLHGWDADGNPYP